MINKQLENDVDAKLRNRFPAYEQPDVARNDDGQTLTTTCFHRTKLKLIPDEGLYKEQKFDPSDSYKANSVDSVRSVELFNNDYIKKNGDDSKTKEYGTKTFFERKVILHKLLSKDEKKVVEFIWRTSNNESDIVFKRKELQAQLGIFKSLFPNVKVATEYSIESGADLIRRRRVLESNINAVLAQSPYKSFHNFNLVFFPMITTKGSHHFYLMCFKMKTAEIDIIDNLNNDVDDIGQRYGNLPIYLIIYVNSIVSEIVKVEKNVPVFVSWNSYLMLKREQEEIELGNFGRLPIVEEDVDATKDVLDKNEDFKSLNFEEMKDVLRQNLVKCHKLMVDTDPKLKIAISLNPKDKELKKMTEERNNLFLDFYKEEDNNGNIEGEEIDGDKNRKTNETECDTDKEKVEGNKDECEEDKGNEEQQETNRKSTVNATVESTDNVVDVLPQICVVAQKEKIFMQKKQRLLKNNKRKKCCSSKGK
ncbi:hypothetical protein Tco_1368975 [Tanacetum coccineum]